MTLSDSGSILLNLLDILYPMLYIIVSASLLQGQGIRRQKYNELFTELRTNSIDPETDKEIISFKSSRNIIFILLILMPLVFICLRPFGGGHVFMIGDYRQFVSIYIVGITLIIGLYSLCGEDIYIKNKDLQATPHISCATGEKESKKLQT